MSSPVGSTYRALLLGMLAPLPLGVALAHVAQTPSQRCQAAKLLATGSAARASLVCAAETSGGQGWLDCIAKVDAALLAAFVRAEKHGGCATTGDASVLRSEVSVLRGSMTVLLRPDGSAPSRCTDMELRAGGRAVLKLARAHVRARRSANAAALPPEVADVRRMFDASFARGGMQGDCLSPTSAANAFELLERQVVTFVGLLFPTCGNGVVDAGEACDGTACPESQSLGDYACQEPSCQCCAQDGPCYIRGFGRTTPGLFPCCNGACNVPGPEAGADVEAFCESLPTCPCFTRAALDAAFPPGYFDLNGRGGAVCRDESTSVAIFSAGTCTWNRPPLPGPFEFSRAGAGVVPGEACGPLTPDIDPDDDGNCDTIFGILQSVTPLEAAACIDELRASQLWQAECQ